MKKLPALSAAILFGLGVNCNQAQTKFNAQLTPDKQEQYETQKSDSYLYDLKNELRTVWQLNKNKKLSQQNSYFLWYYTQKVTELELLLKKHSATFSKQSLQKIQLAIQIKIDEIELLKDQAHHNFNDTNIIGL